MKSIQALLGLLGIVSAWAGDTPASGGYGTKFLTEDKHAPAQRSVDDAKLLEIRNAAKFGGFAEQDGTPKDWSLEQNSEFISFEASATLLPAHAIIHVPEKLRSHVTPGLKGKFMAWQEFAARYRAVVTTFDVTLDEASGKTPLKPERIESLRKLDVIAVAVLNGAPISFRGITTPAKP
ncbi:MAG: hypothetical protein ABI162_19910 [Luteolibacter sp.]